MSRAMIIAATLIPYQRLKLDTLKGRLITVEQTLLAKGNTDHPEGQEAWSVAGGRQITQPQAPEVPQ